MKKLHISLIIVGIVLILIGTFHGNIWYDEAYTVGMMHQSWGDMIETGINDVHPLLYYVIAKIYTMIFGISVTSLRIFSVIGAVILAVIGYTHIRKEFGEKIGFFFSFLTLFLPIMPVYATEIRMYSWAAVLVTLAAFYAYKIIKYNKTKDYVLFVVFAVLSAYIHYFATLAIILINIIFMFFMIKDRRDCWKKWLIVAVSQIVLFIPGMIILLRQMTSVIEGGYWINITYPNVLGEIIEYHFKGVASGNIVGYIAGMLYIYCIVKLVLECKKNKKEAIPAVIAIGIYFGVIAIALIVSAVKRDIFITRYTMPMIGLLIFFIAFILAKEKRQWLTGLICGAILMVYAMSTSIYYINAYSQENGEMQQEISQELQKEDIFIYREIALSGVIAELFPDNQQYFYNIYNWDVEKSYGAFAPQMKCVSSLDDIDFTNKRVWVIDNDSWDTYKSLDEYGDLSIQKESKRYWTPYKGYAYVVNLVELTK